MTTGWMSSRPAAGGLLTVAAAAFLLSGCSSQNRTAYCVNRSTNQVADNSACNNGGSGGAYFFGTGRSGYGQGSVLPAGPRANVDDPGARQNLGIAGSGSVGSKGGFGSAAKSSSSSGGGFSSGGHGSAGG
ncbi:MAG TPA: hypothetical protein VES02_03900 [Dermatophilaceae bacterium]|nr:hypothetical protein [Dermatophilaceae bacterium]